MIAKVTQGASGRALIRYLFGPGRANEHTDQRVITSGIVMGVEEGRALTAAEIADLGTAVEAIGFEREGLQPAAWVTVGHGTSASGNPHIHIAASLVRGDGLGVNLWQSKRTLSRVCHEIEHAYGLTIVEGREGKGMTGLTRAELERTAM